MAPPSGPLFLKRGNIETRSTHETSRAHILFFCKTLLQRYSRQLAPHEVRREPVAHSDLLILMREDVSHHVGLETLQPAMPPTTHEVSRIRAYQWLPRLPRALALRQPKSIIKALHLTDNRHFFHDSFQQNKRDSISPDLSSESSQTCCGPLCAQK